MQRSKKYTGMRKGILLWEIVMGILVLGVITAYGINRLSGQKDNVLDTNSIINIVQDTHTSLIQFKDDNEDNTKDYSNLTPTKAKAFFDSKKFTLTGGILVPVEFSSAQINLLPAPNSVGTNNKTYKVIFDFSAVKDERHWSDQEAMKFETKIANFYKGQSLNSIIGGASTSLGSANTSVVASATDGDAIIVIQFDK